jgi:hypothetical protein
VADLQAMRRWRDPDSNRGHHDFQSEPAHRRTATKGLQIAKSPMRVVAVGFTAVCGIYPRLWAPSSSSVPNGARLRCQRRAPSDKRDLDRDSRASGAMGRTRTGPPGARHWPGQGGTPCGPVLAGPARTAPGGCPDRQEGPDGHLQQGRARRPHKGASKPKYSRGAPSGSNLDVGGGISARWGPSPQRSSRPE